MALRPMWVKCEAVRYMDSGTVPGFIEAYLTDTSGFRWQIVDKSVMFREFDELESPTASYPREASLPCVVLTDSGGPNVTIAMDAAVFDRGSGYEVSRASLSPRS